MTQTFNKLLTEDKHKRIEKTPSGLKPAPRLTPKAAFDAYGAAMAEARRAVWLMPFGPRKTAAEARLSEIASRAKAIVAKAVR